ncbi:helix-turn-helix transcriptional regulator [Limnohabitans sp.]|uniref:helix-turn-helix domain-containing protein n=1 Tax=Limnohabitans sp. TaxID=1907725 RepID=UPI00286EE964|nr:helix-turn-helix transcriptional regulator [Limnohabitans sp.]
MREHIGYCVRMWSVNKRKKPIELAKAAGVSLAQQYRIEAGESTPDVLYLIKVSKFLELSVDELLNAPSANSERTKEHRAASPIVQNNSGSGVVQIGGVTGEVKVHNPLKGSRVKRES